VSVLMAVDVGGSGMRAVLSRDGISGRVRTDAGARISAGRLDVGALAAVVGSLRPTDVRIDVLVFAARGIVTLADPADVLVRLGSLGARRTVVCSDAVTSLIGAVGGVRPGAVVAAGTGAVAFGCDFAGVYRRVDGWGHVLGDRGSAAWVGLQALRGLLLRRDQSPNQVGTSALWTAAVERFGPVQTWPGQVMNRPDAPELLAAFAPSVTASAHSDPLAGRICGQAGSSLADSLLAAADGLPTGATLSRAGGVFGADAVQTAFDTALATAGRNAAPPAGTSLDGALLLAAEVHAERAPVGHQPYLLLG